MRNPVRSIFNFFVGSCLAVVLLIAALIGGVYGYIYCTSKQASVVPDKAFLVIRLEDTFVDQSSKAQALTPLAWNSTHSRTIPLLHAVRAIDQAKADPKIAGIFICGMDSTLLGLSALSELRSALKTFKEAGKPIVAYLTHPGLREYYLSTVADQVILHPLSVFEFKGLSAEALYFGEAFRKYGVGVQVVKAGKYKAMPEVFTSDRMTPENQEQLSSLIKVLWQEVKTQIGTDRQLAGLEMVEKQGLMTPAEALAWGLVDGVEQLDTVVAQLVRMGAQDLGNASFKQIHIADYCAHVRRKQEKKPGASKAHIGLLYLEGAIVDGEGTEDQAACERLVREIVKLRNDPLVAAVVVRVQSPGGSAYASERIQRELSLLKEAKPLVIAMGRVAASGGYWIAAHADAIFATPYTITGSIGVFNVMFNVQQLAQQHGLVWDGVKTSPFADIDSPTRPKSPEELQLMQRFVDDVYEQFVAKVAEARKLEVVEAEAVAQGRIWTGGQAKEHKLVTHIGSLQDALAYAAELAQLEKDFAFKEFPAEKPFTQLLAEYLGTRPTYPVTGVRRIDRYLQNYYQALPIKRSLGGAQHTYALLPLEIAL